MTLVGNAKNPFAPRLLAKVADEIRLSLAEAPQDAAWTPGRLAQSMRNGMEGQGLSWTTDLGPALAEADIVLVATSSDTVLVDPTQLRRSCQPTLGSRSGALPDPAGQYRLGLSQRNDAAGAVR